MVATGLFIAVPPIFPTSHPARPLPGTGGRWRQKTVFQTDPLPGTDPALAVVTTTDDAFTTPAGQVMPEAQNIQTYVLAKGADGWRVVHGHNVVVNAEATKHDPANAPRQ